MLNESLKMLKMSKYGYSTLMKYTGIDLNKSVAVEFNEKYNKKIHYNDLFLFFKNDYLVGILKNGVCKKDLLHLVDTNTIQNWKNLKLNSNKILRIPQDKLTYEYKPSRRIVEKSHKKLLQERLIEYKAKKNENLSINDLKHITKESSQIITNLMLEPEEKQKEFMIKLKNILWWSSFDSNISNGFKKIMDHLEDLNRYDDQIKKYDKLFSYEEDCLNKIKVEILDFNKILKSFI